MSYEFTRLLSPFEAVRLIRRFTRFRTTILLPPISEFEIAGFSKGRRILAAIYNRMLALGVAILVLPVCPFSEIFDLQQAKNLRNIAATTPTHKAILPRTVSALALQI